MRKKFASQKGASLVEFALILILLIVITFGIIEFGMLIYNKQVITNASREGARAGIVASLPRVSDAGIDSVVQNYCANHLVTFGAQNDPVTTVTGYSPTALLGSDLQVAVAYNYHFLILPNFLPGIDELLDDDKLFNIQAVTVMRYE